MIERVKKTFTNCQKYENTLVEVQGKSQPRKEPQCSYRLLNIIFSDEFAEKFAYLGNVTSCHLLNQGKAGNDQYFWQEIWEVFVNETEYYSELLFTNNNVFAGLENIDPSEIIQHDWKKL